MSLGSPAVARHEDPEVEVGPARRAVDVAQRNGVRSAQNLELEHELISVADW